MSKPLMLIVEVDGSIHDLPHVAAKDAQRTKALESVGFCVVRFRNHELLQNKESVRIFLYQWIENHKRSLSSSTR